MRRLFVSICLILSGIPAFGQDVPPVYVLPAVDKAVIVLGDAPENTWGFQVYRKARGEREYQLMTPEPITAAEDPYEAVQLMGKDFQWISRKMDNMDPTAVWRKLSLNRNLAEAYSLLSHGLRLALGRTWVDTDVLRGQRYYYRVVLLNAAGKEIEHYEQRIIIEDPKQPPPPKNITVSYEDGMVSIDWEYPPFRGGKNDRTVGFVLLRRTGTGSFEALSPAPILRIEGYLNAFDDKVRFGKTYTYAVVALDIIGVISSRVEAPPLSIEDTAPPLVPTGLKATDRGEDVLLIWKMSPELDVTHYNVFRTFSVQDDAELTKLNLRPIPFDEPRFVDDTAPRGVPLYYRVTALDKRGNKSALSGPAPLLAEDKDPPGPVEKLLARVNEEERTVVLTWRAPKDQDLAGYYVYSGSDASRLMRITAAPLEPEKRSTFADKGYKERGLEPGRSLVYGVSSVDASYNEGPREIVEVQIPDNVPPDPPSGFSVRPTRDGMARLSWQPLLCFDLAAYRVYRSTKKKFSIVTELDSTDTSWLDGDLDRGTLYRYYLTSVDTSGNESEQSPEMEIVPTDINPPSPPLELKAQIVRRGVSLSWEPSPDTDVKNYRVYRSEYPGGKPERMISEGEDALKFLDRRGSEGLIYAVSTVDTSGNEGVKLEVRAE